MNAFLDPLPTEYECSFGKVCQLNTDYRIGIQICMVQEDSELAEQEKVEIILNLLFGDDESNLPDSAEDARECIGFFTNGWYMDNPSQKKAVKSTDFTVDQWRIVAGFRQQYRIDILRVDMHFWEFMGLLSCLQDCSYTKVIEIRQKKIDKRMDAQDRKLLLEAKKVYKLGETLTLEEKNEQDEVFALLEGRTLEPDDDEKRRIEEFEKYADE